MWIFPKVKLTPEEKKNVVATVVKMASRAMFKKHYEFGGKKFQQLRGVLLASGALAQWLDSLCKYLTKNGIKSLKTRGWTLNSILDIWMMAVLFYTPSSMGGDGLRVGYTSSRIGKMRIVNSALLRLPRGLSWTPCRGLKLISSLQLKQGKILGLRDGYLPWIQI